jgi:hypothetical protein
MLESPPWRIIRCDDPEHILMSIQSGVYRDFAMQTRVGTLPVVSTGFCDRLLKCFHAQL